MAGWPRQDARQPAAGTAVPRPAPDVTLPAVRLAWVDYGGQLHLGNLASRDQHVVATVDASPADPMIQADGHLYWADSRSGAAPIRDYDIATSQDPVPGPRIFGFRGRRPPAYLHRAGRHQADRAARQWHRPATAAGFARRWHLSGGLGNWSVAGGIVIYSGPADERRGLPAVGVWNPGTGQVKIIGRALDVLDTVTRPGARYSLLAWSSGCLRHCQLGITNTATLARVTVRSPGRYGFTYGGPFSSGAFSPDGRHLAVFLNTTDPQDPYRLPYSELGIASTGTGVLRLVPAVRLVTTEDVAWARWLPGGRLLAGAESGSYAVNTQTLAARPFSFSGSPGQDIMSSGDINFSATVLRAP